jgi:hypothetical protein
MRVAARLQLLLDRIELRLSHSGRVDGLWVGCFTRNGAAAFGRMESAFGRPLGFALCSPRTVFAKN